MYLAFIHICGAFCRCCCVLMVAGQECQLKCRKPYSGLGVPRRIPWIRDVSPDVTMFWGLCHVSWWQHGSHTGKNECWRSCQDTTSCQNNWNNTHTHNPSCRGPYQKWMELCRTATRNCETNFVAFGQIRNVCVNSMDDFVQEVILPQGSFLDCNCWGHLRLRRDETETNCDTICMCKSDKTAAPRPCTSTRVHPSGLYARCFEWLGESLRFSHSENSETPDMS